jgi:hypothetical protein
MRRARTIINAGAQLDRPSTNEALASARMQVSRHRSALAAHHNEVALRIDAAHAHAGEANAFGSSRKSCMSHPHSRRQVWIVHAIGDQYRVASAFRRMDVFVAKDPDEIVVGAPLANVIASQGFCPPAGSLMVFQRCNVPRRRRALIRGARTPLAKRAAPAPCTLFVEWNASRRRRALIRGR